MTSGPLLKVCMMCVFALTVLSLGCAHTISSESTRIRQASWQADLDEYHEVLLFISRVQDSENGEATGTREELRLEVRPRQHLQFESLLKSVELRPGAPRGEFWFDDIEVRADESTRRVWFVDVAAQRVIATLDRDTRATTGPDDEPPSWATVDGGVVLRASE